MRNITITAMVVPALALLVWDIYVATNDIKDDTISEITRDWSSEFYTLPFVFGVVMGHLFINSGLQNRFKLVWPCVFLVALLDVCHLTLPAGNAIFFAFGIGTGALLWPQKVKNVAEISKES